MAFLNAPALADLKDAPPLLGGDRPSLVVVGGGLAGCEAAWQHANSVNISRNLEARLQEGVDVAANVRFMREHPLSVAAIFARCMMEVPFLVASVRGFVGNLGTLSVQLPDWVLWMYLALLVTAAATQTRYAQLTLFTRAALVIFAAGAVASVLGVGWIGSLPKAVLDDPPVRSHVLVPFQGRYWIPFAFPMFVVLSTGRTWLNPRCFLWAAGVVVVVANCVAFRMMLATYYR